MGQRRRVHRWVVCVRRSLDFHVACLEAQASGRSQSAEIVASVPPEPDGRPEDVCDDASLVCCVASDTAMVNRRRVLRSLGVGLLALALMLVVLGAVGIWSGPSDSFCPAWTGCPPDMGPIWQVTLLGIGAVAAVAAVLILRRAYLR